MEKNESYIFTLNNGVPYNSNDKNMLLLIPEKLDDNLEKIKEFKQGFSFSNEEKIKFQDGILFLRKKNSDYIEGFINDFGKFVSLSKYYLDHNFEWTYNEEKVILQGYLIYDMDGKFSEGLLAVCDHWKWGFIDKTGKKVVPCIYDECMPFIEGLAAVLKDDKWGFVDKTGKEVVPCIYNDILPFKEGLAAVFKDEGWGFIDKIGKEVLPFIYEYADSFDSGLACVKTTEGYGYIDKSGKEVIPCIYDGTDSNVLDYSGQFSEGLVSVKKGDEWIFIDRNGNEITSDIYEKYFDDHESFRNGVVVLSKKKTGETVLLNELGQEILKTDWRDRLYSRYADNYNDNKDYPLFINYKEDDKGHRKWGYINKFGETVIPFIYDRIGRFSEGLAPVFNDGRKFYIDISGREVLSCGYDYIGNFSEGLAAVKKDEKWGFIDKTGKEICPPTYKEAFNFSEGKAVVQTLDGEYIVIDTNMNKLFSITNSDKEEKFIRGITELSPFPVAYNISTGEVLQVSQIEKREDIHDFEPGKSK